MPRSRRTVVLTITYVIVSLVLLNAAGWFYYVKTARSVRAQEKALDDRLASTAGGIARRLDSFHVSVLRPGDERHVFFQQTRRMLEVERDDHGVDGIHVLGADRRVMLSSSGRFKIGDEIALSELPADTFASALSGVARVSPVIVLGDDWAKSAAAPVVDPEGRVVACVVVVASADALELVRVANADLLHLMLGIAVMSVVAAAVLSSVLWVTLRALLREEEALRRSEKLALAGTLAAGVAHEVRNPLGVISGMAELLIERSPKDSRESALARDILAEVQKLNRVVGDFLDFSRPQPTHATDTPAAELISRPLEMLGPSFLRKKITVRTEVPAGLPPVVADTGRIQQVLLNLFLNARDAMPDGGELSVAVRESHGRIELAVQDTGAGIRPEDLPRIFEPFFTTKERGTGLGLAVARRIAEEHGGSLSVESRGGAGTVFRLALPAGRKGA